MFSTDKEKSKASIAPTTSLSTVPLSSSLNKASKTNASFSQSDYEASSAAYLSDKTQFRFGSINANKGINFDVDGGGNFSCEVEDTATTKGEFRLAYRGNSSPSVKQNNTSSLNPSVFAPLSPFPSNAVSESSALAANPSSEGMKVNINQASATNMKFATHLHHHAASKQQEIKDYQLNFDTNIKGQVGEAGFEMANASNIPHDKELLMLTLQQQKETLKKRVNSKLTVEETGVVGSIVDKVGNINFAPHAAPPVANIQAPSPASILNQYELLSPISERIFLRRAKRYHQTLEKEEDEDIIELCEELKGQLTAYKQTIKNKTVSETQRKSEREEIRTKITEIEEMKEEDKKEIKNGRKAQC